MTFCYDCGQPLVERIPAGDDMPRDCCDACGYVHYNNPRVLVSCMVHTQSSILWIQRGLEPRKGFWAMPAGFMEQGESLQEATVREVEEETGLKLDPAKLELSVLSSLTFINEVYVVFRAYHKEMKLSPPSSEVETIGFLAEHEVPWEQLAYPATEPYMRAFYREARDGQYNTYLGEFSRLQQKLEKMHSDKPAS
jgi:ADP-ribose pyrophosphatase YjhB (NUDIX family)